MKKFFPHSFEKAVAFCEMLNECYNQYYCRKRSVAWNWLMTVRSSCQEVFYKNGVLENFATLTGKHLRRVSFLKKLQAWGLQLYLRRDPNTGVFVWTLQNFSVQLFSGNNSSGSMWTCLSALHQQVFCWDSLHASLNSHCKARIFKKKKHKMVKTYGNLFRKNLQLIAVC